MLDTIQIPLHIPREALTILKQEPNAFAQELVLAAAVKWYELGQISQSKAAELARVSRSEFLTALHRYEVSPFQYTTEELLAELTDD